jgi:hypothetical protein
MHKDSVGLRQARFLKALHEGIGSAAFALAVLLTAIGCMILIVICLLFYGILMIAAGVAHSVAKVCDFLVRILTSGTANSG